MKIDKNKNIKIEISTPDSINKLNDIKINILGVEDDNEKEKEENNE